METLLKVREILAEQLDIDIDSITENTDIAEDLGADSLDVVELMITIEEEYGITVDEEQVRGFVTVGDVAAYIEAKA